MHSNFLPTLIAWTSAVTESGNIINRKFMGEKVNQKCGIFFLHRRSYRQKVISNKKESVYQANGWHTFFIPVEEGFKVSTFLLYIAIALTGISIVFNILDVSLNRFIKIYSHIRDLI